MTPLIRNRFHHIHQRNESEQILPKNNMIHKSLETIPYEPSHDFPQLYDCFSLVSTSSLFCRVTVKKDLDEEEPPALNAEASAQVLEVDIDTCLDRCSNRCQYNCKFYIQASWILMEINNRISSPKALRFESLCPSCGWWPQPQPSVMNLHASQQLKLWIYHLWHLSPCATAIQRLDNITCNGSFLGVMELSLGSSSINDLRSQDIEKL